jgi:hypothetical protein
MSGCYAVARNAETGTLRTAAGLESPRAALRMLVHVWQRPGVILQDGTDAALVVIYRIDHQWVIRDAEGHPVSDTSGGVWCPRCHAGPGRQDPHYATHNDGTAYPSGVFRCGSCSNLHRPPELL